MPIEITMPRLSDTMEAGTVIKWNVSEGDKVSAGDVVADIETDKATMEMQVFDDGVIAKIISSEGETVEVGTVIAVLAEEGEDPAEVAGGAGAAKASKVNDEPAPTAGSADGASDGASDGATNDQEEPARPATKVATIDGGADRSTGTAVNGATSGRGEDRGSSGRMLVTPVARRLAEDNGIDLKSLSGSGPQGRIIKRDVLRAMEGGGPAEEAPTAAPVSRRAGLEATTIQLSNMRQTIARRLAESKSTIPHYQVSMSFDLDPLMDLRSQLNAQLDDQGRGEGVKLSINDFLVKACALCIPGHPEFNGSFRGDHVEIHGHVNIGVAISRPREAGGGLVVATLRDADRMSLRDISSETRRLAKKAREKGLTIEEMSDSTFTISNLGMYGVDHFTAIINPPNSAILAVGAGIEQPVVKNGELAIGHRMTVTLSNDHRIIDGAMAAEFLQDLKGMVERPLTMLV